MSYISALTCNHEPKCANDHDDGLDEICPNDSSQTSYNGEQGGDDEQHNDGQVDVPA